MDALVVAAMAKWPNVPRCRGWLGLDARGAWRLRDEAVQSAGSFTVARGDVVGNARLRDFIGRNYLRADDGCWFFQNGPQRVDVELEAAPWVWRLAGDPAMPEVTSHTGLVATATDAWLDEAGRVFLAADIGFGIVHSLDTGIAAEAIERAAWSVRTMPFGDMPRHFGYCLSPATRDGASG